MVTLKTSLQEILIDNPVDFPLFVPHTLNVTIEYTILCSASTALFLHLIYSTFKEAHQVQLNHQALVVEIPTAEAVVEPLQQLP